MSRKIKFHIEGIDQLAGLGFKMEKMIDLGWKIEQQKAQQIIKALSLNTKLAHALQPFHGLGFKMEKMIDLGWELGQQIAQSGIKFQSFNPEFGHKLPVEKPQSTNPKSPPPVEKPQDTNPEFPKKRRIGFV